jgi:hypothetical protein
MAVKDKKGLKKESSSINSQSNNSSSNTDNGTFKFINLKKNKSPGSTTTTVGTVT